MISNTIRFLKKKICRKVKKVLLIKSIFASSDDYGRYQHAVQNRKDSQGIVDLRLKETGEYPVFVRLKSSDCKVLADTFLTKYHIPLDDISPVRTILDLGCNVGYTLRHYAFLYPGASLYGVELDNGNYTMALKNTIHLPQCTVRHAGVWSDDGPVGYSGSDEQSYHIVGQKGKIVDGKTIVTLMHEWGLDTVDFLKMDIEGAERTVFGGKNDWLDRVRALMLEIHDGNTEWYAKILEKSGFSCREHPEHWSSLWAVKNE